MKDKTLDCLKYAAMPVCPERDSFFLAITTKYSEKVVNRKLEELKRRGQVCFGPDGLTLTDSGKTFLDSFSFSSTI